MITHQGIISVIKTLAASLFILLFSLDSQALTLKQLKLRLKARGLEAEEEIQRFKKKKNLSQKEKCLDEGQTFFLTYSDKEASKAAMVLDDSKKLLSISLDNATGEELKKAKIEEIVKVVLTLHIETNTIAAVGVALMPKPWSVVVTPFSREFLIDSDKCRHSFKPDNYFYPESKVLKKK